jgi:hypothetical protein
MERRESSFFSDFGVNSAREAANSKWNHHHTHDMSDSVRSISTSFTGIAAAIVHSGFFFGGAYCISVGWIGMNKMKLLNRKLDHAAEQRNDAATSTDIWFWAPNILLCALGGYISLTSWASAREMLQQLK